MRHHHRASRRRPISLWTLLFGLPFALVGVFMGYKAASMVIEWNAMQGWVSVPATITEVELQRYRSKRSYTYKTTARYRYEFEGRPYTGDRVSLRSDADNIDSFHQDAFQELEAHRRSGAPRLIRVDPSAPQRAIIYSHLDSMTFAFSAIFAALFGGVGFGVVALVLVSRRQERSVQHHAERYPDQPWHHRSDWSRGYSASNAASSFVVVAVIAAILVSVSLALVFAGLAPQPPKVAVAVIGAVLLVLSGVVSAAAVRNYLRWRRYGQARLVFATLPVAPGGRIAGAIHTAAELDPSDGGEAVLLVECEETVPVVGRKKNRTERTILWTVEHRSTVQCGASESVIPLDIPIPADLPESSLDDHRVRHGERRYRWTLRVEVPTPGVDFWAEFDLPVFSTGTGGW